MDISLGNGKDVQERIGENEMKRYPSSTWEEGQDLKVMTLGQANFLSWW